MGQEKTTILSQMFGLQLTEQNGFPYLHHWTLLVHTWPSIWQMCEIVLDEQYDEGVRQVGQYECVAFEYHR